MPAIPLHISAFFIAMVFAIAFVIIIAVYVCCNRANLSQSEKNRRLLLTIFVILGWLTFTLIVGVSGMLADFTTRPPKLLWMALPAFMLVIALVFWEKFNELAKHLDNFWFIYPQAFRIIMEFIFWSLYRYKVLPVQMTFEGRNFDILVGLTAPIIVYYCFTKKIWSPKVALAWNFAGLILLANAVATAILSTPYPYRIFMTEPANTIVFYFPFIWLPTFVVPFALLLHLASIKRLMSTSPA